MLRHAWLWALLLSAVACGGSSDDDDDNSSSGIPVQDLPLSLGEAGCGKIYQCCSAEERMANPFLGEDAESCAVTVAAFTSLLVPAIQDAVAGDRAEYDGVALQHCIAVMQAQSCTEARSGSTDVSAASGCAPFLIPQVVLGGECEESFECIDGWCDDAAGSLCSPLKADGSECSDAEECQSDYCDSGAGCGPEPASTGDNLCGG
jgi:hypothetical protein